MEKVRENWVVHIWKGAFASAPQLSGPSELHWELSTVLLGLLFLEMRRSRDCEERLVLRSS